MPSQWLAVAPGVDPRARARQLRRSWERLLGDSELSSPPPHEAGAGMRRPIVDSWRRSLGTGLDPAGWLAPVEADRSEILDRFAEHPLGPHRHVLAEQLQPLAEDSQSLIVVSDASGLLLHVHGADWLKERAGGDMNFVEGARWSEAAAGTNAIGTALAANHPLQVFAFEHFNPREHAWTCSASPVLDPVSGRVLGIVDLTGPWKTVHPLSLAMVTAAARTLEHSLAAARWERDARLRRRYADLATRTTDVLVTPDGYVLAGRPAAAGAEPLAIPEGGGEILLGDGSPAAAEPLGRGEAYLVRSRTAHARAGAPPRLEPAEERARELAGEQAALRRVATLVARESAPQRLFQVVAEEVARILDVPLVRVVRFRPGGSEIELVGGWGESAASIEVGRRRRLAGQGVLASVWRTGRSARLDDYSSAPGPAATVMREAGMASAAASPIAVEGRIWGAVVVLAPGRQSLPEDAEARLADFTELVAAAIANSEARDDLRRLLDEQASLRRVATLVAEGARPENVVSSVAREVAQVFAAGTVTVCRHEPAGVAVLASVGGPELRAGSRLGFPTAGLDPRPPEAGARAAIGVPIVVDGRGWGSIELVAAADGPPFPADAGERLARFAELVATAVSNATMRSELAASRARVIAAADETRRRIERDLHDGAQQQLVALALGLRSTEASVPAELDDLRAELGRHADRLTDVIEELREMSRGIHPAILTEGGLGPALEALSLRSAVPVSLSVRCGRRLPDGVEVAAYYVASEALTNAAKHAGASRAWIDLGDEGRALVLSIRDDGTGGADPAGGSGLVGLRDRVESLGGTIALESPPGGGTRLDVELPLPAAPPLDEVAEASPPSGRLPQLGQRGELA